MKTFLVHGSVVGSKFLGEIEAETAEEALKRAPRELDGFHVSLCYQCESECEDPEIYRYSVESEDGEETAQEDGFWESEAHKHLARVRELEQRIAKLVSERDRAVDDRGFYVHDIKAEDVEDLVAAAQAEALEEAAKAVEEHLRDADFIRLPIQFQPPPPRRYATVISVADVIRKLKPDVTKHPDSSSS